jgi:hypothetical protein
MGASRPRWALRVEGFGAVGLMATNPLQPRILDAINLTTPANQLENPERDLAAFLRHRSR